MESGKRSIQVFRLGGEFGLLEEVDMGWRAGSAGWRGRWGDS